MTATDLYRIRAILVHALEAIEMTIDSPTRRAASTPKSVKPATRWISLAVAAENDRVRCWVKRSRH